MISINLHSGQGLGNQLWIIATGYCLSLKNNTTFEILSPNFFKGSSIFDLDKYLNRMTNYKKIKKNIFHESMYYHKKQNCFVFSFDKNINDTAPDTAIEGNFQSIEYFFGYIKELKKLLNPKQDIINTSLQFSNYGVLNIRGGEYKRSKNLLLPKSYWLNTYKRLFEYHEKKNIICVTDDYKYSKYLFPDMEIISGSIEQCFSALLGCKNASVSNSSFAFFPLFLNKNINKVYAPYQWSRFNNIENVWFNPCNYYPEWNWVDFNNQIVSTEKCLFNIKKSLNYFYNNFDLLNFQLDDEPTFIKFKYLKLKLIIKKILGIFFLRYS